MQQARADEASNAQPSAFTLEPERNPAFAGLGAGELALLLRMIGTPASERVLELMGLSALAEDERCQSLSASSLAARGLLKSEGDGALLPQHVALAVVYVVREARHWVSVSMLDEGIERERVVVVEADEGALLFEYGQLDSFQVSVVDASLPMVEMLRELVDSHLALAEDGIAALEAMRIDIAGAPKRTLAIRLAEDVDDTQLDAELYDLARGVQVEGAQETPLELAEGSDAASLEMSLGQLVLWR